MSMICNSDFEKLWVLYKTEGEPQGVSINAFCISRGVNYNEFFDERSGKAERNKWFRKMHKSVVTLEVEGAPSSESKVTIEPMEDEAKTRKDGIQVFIRTNDGLKIQYGLGYLQAVIVDTTVGILSQTQLFCKQRTDTKPRAIKTRLVMAEVPRRKTKLDAFPEFGNSFNRLVQDTIGHGELWCRGLMIGFVQGVRHLPAPLSKTEIDSEYCIQREVGAAWH